MLLSNLKKIIYGETNVVRKMVRCETEVDKNAIQRVTRDGIEYVVVTSKTLPDNIVMNGGLYPADEINKSMVTLERTLAPVEHPVNMNGNFISASDPDAINNFYAGAYNENVRSENGRVVVDKVINVQEALKTERGKRLLDRIKDLENNTSSSPIHTSVGVFVEVEELDAPQVNQLGQEYTWIARNMVFDHDAILLDSVGAAQPDQGVGMAVNEDGKTLDSERCIIDHYSLNSQNKCYSAKDLNKPEGSNMKDMLVSELKEAGISVDEMSDSEILTAYNNLKVESLEANQNGAEKENEDKYSTILNSLDAITSRISKIENDLIGNSQKELNDLAEIVGNSEQYKVIGVEGAKKLGVDSLKEMAANCMPSHGIPMDLQTNDSTHQTFDMPE